jgi:hypothetical protein
MQYTLTGVRAPSYAPTGEQGFYITVQWSAMFTNPVDGVYRQSGAINGWVSRLPDGEVISTLDSYPWQSSPTRATAEEWSENWVWQHGSEIINAATFQTV